MKDTVTSSLPPPPDYNESQVPPASAAAAAAAANPNPTSYYQSEETRDFIPDDFKYSVTVTSCEPRIRRWFMRKVYTLLSCQLVSSFAFCFWVSRSPKIQDAIYRHQVLYVLVALAGLVSCVWLTLAPRASDYDEEYSGLTSETQETQGTATRPASRQPWYCLSYRGQLILLAFFTLCEAYTLSLVTLVYDPRTILSALFITGTVVVGITAMALSDRFETTVTASNTIYYWLNLAMWLLIGIGFSSIFFGMNAKVDLLYSWLGAAVFTVYLFIDTQLIFRKVYPDEEIRCAMMLYLDIINLFLYILRILGRNRED
ncbi:LAME_0F15214g1_1 [Lachancea meyersii CBS 8951]|uniref:LAME_0F15214g1_1 n=1 Tax=Lachancea meyersii CBS 8951 TaxID=1266667 RepID=A0A1G4JYD5_9SACH|nr:LAME_0F15214g1_1 [Lachancea meyersii CBS 8951]